MAGIWADAYTVFYCPGMGGSMPPDRKFVRSLGRSGLDDVRVHDWPCFNWPLNNLRNPQQHHEAAQTLATMVRMRRMEAGERRIVLIGHSTGALVVLKAAAMLEAGLVDQVWLLAAAVSRGYDLSPALAKASRIVNIHSKRDYVMLLLGTCLCGAADGIRGPSAGCKPFLGPGCDHQGLEQWPYQQAWRKCGNRGGHMGPLSERFAAEVIAPGILQRQVAEVAS